LADDPVPQKLATINVPADAPVLWTKVEHLALAPQHAVMSADVSELQVAAAHGALALAELYSLLVAPADPVLQKLSGGDGGAMVEHLALSVQHAVMSPAVLVVQVPASHWALAAAGLYTLPVLPWLRRSLWRCRCRW
jgi:hypothetical protein